MTVQQVRIENTQSHQTVKIERKSAVLKSQITVLCKFLNYSFTQLFLPKVAAFLAIVLHNWFKLRICRSAQISCLISALGFYSAREG